MADFTSFPIPTYPLAEVDHSSLADAILVVNNGIVRQVSIDNIKSVLDIDDVDNIPDDEKGISAATQAALDKKMNVATTLIESDESLDDVITTGIYAFRHAEKGTLGRPISKSGHMLVMRSSTSTKYAFQLVSAEGSSDNIYYRNQYTSSGSVVWTDWHVLTNREDMYYNVGDSIEGSNVYVAGLINSTGTACVWTVPLNKPIASNVAGAIDTGSLAIRQAGKFITGSNSMSKLSDVFSDVSISITPSGLVYTGTFAAPPANAIKNMECSVRHSYRITLN